MVNSELRIVLVIHNVRSALNVGSLLRTAEGFAVNEVYITGYTPYPEAKDDQRLPHHRRRTALQIHKTALGAEYLMNWHHQPNIKQCLERLSQNGYMLVGLEQTPDALDLNKFNPKQDLALIVGNEVTGLEKTVLKQMDQHLQIPMSGRKESFNVAIAAGIALYHLRQG
ncbi:TrmH family RNA methyltransferase [Candidatus Saccharibacteria bacterium]|nr:TrmH family RNA methyltransferase [Candidatus Saccharibacteria bacterium]